MNVSSINCTPPANAHPVNVARVDMERAMAISSAIDDTFSLKGGDRPSFEAIRSAAEGARNANHLLWNASERSSCVYGGAITGASILADAAADALEAIVANPGDLAQMERNSLIAETTLEKALSYIEGLPLG